MVENSDSVKGRRAKGKIRNKRNYEEQEKERNKDKQKTRKGIKNKLKRWDGAKRNKTKI